MAEAEPRDVQTHIETAETVNTGPGPHVIRNVERMHMSGPVSMHNPSSEVPAPQDLHVKVWSSKSVAASWAHVDKADSYVFTVSVEGKEPFEILTKDTRTFIEQKDYDFELGKTYTIGVQAKWQGRRGPSAKKSFKVGLPAAENLRCNLDREDPQHKAMITWTKSEQVNVYRIEVKQGKTEISTEYLPGECNLECDQLEPNKKYTVNVWPGDGIEFYDNKSSCDFITAPDKPSKVIVRSNMENPTTCLDIEIVSEYTGKFKITCVGINGQNEIMEEKVKETEEKMYTMHGLTPGTSYQVFAQCVLGDFVTEKTEAQYQN